MKKFIGIIASIVFVLAVFVTPSMANGCCGGMVGLEISGGAGVGAQGYIGTAVTRSATNSCFAHSRTLNKQVYIGGGITSSAAGTVCLQSNGNPSGLVAGHGNFNSSVSGNIMGCNFHTSSNVSVIGVGH